MKGESLTETKGSADYESDVRRELIELISGEVPGKAVFINELQVDGGRHRIDLVAVHHEAIHCFEIKSAHDSLRRIESQIAGMEKIADHATIVTADKLVERARERVPPEWGLLCADGTGRGMILWSVRAPRRLRRQDPEALASLLSKEAVTALLGRRKLLRGYRGKPRWLLRKRAAQELRGRTLHAAVRDYLTAAAAGRRRQ